MGRKSITISDEAYDELASFKREQESWSEFAERAANALESQYSADGRDDVNALSEEHIDDIATAVEGRVQTLLENAMRR